VFHALSRQIIWQRSIPKEQFSTAPDKGPCPENPSLNRRGSCHVTEARYSIFKSSVSNFRLKTSLHKNFRRSHSNMKHLINFINLLALICSFSKPAVSQTVEWFDGRAQGSGCRMEDTSIFSFGDEISWVFSDLGINLTGSGGPRAMNKFCNISADARVDQGNYVTEFQQILTYGGIKTQWGSQASISTTARFYGHIIKPFRIDLRNGADFDQALVSQILTDRGASISRADWWCRPNRNPRGKLMGRVAVNGQLIGQPGGSVVINAQSFDIKYSAIMKWNSCR